MTYERSLLMLDKKCIQYRILMNEVFYCLIVGILHIVLLIY